MTSHISPARKKDPLALLLDDDLLTVGICCRGYRNDVHRPLEKALLIVKVVESTTLFEGTRSSKHTQHGRYKGTYQFN